uniref:Uncharacterized protein n=1 Tax=Ditylenchus dipsaci TaxID=166011 RepID=A0A915EB01_9BILA
MDYIWSFRDSIFYGICSCSGAANGVDTEPVPKYSHEKRPLQLKVTESWLFPSSPSASLDLLLLPNSRFRKDVVVDLLTVDPKAGFEGTAVDGAIMD